MISNQNLNFIAIMTFNRPKLLDQLLHSVQNLNELSKYKVVIFQQMGSQETSKVVKKYKKLIYDYVQVLPTKDKVEEKIAESRLRAYRYIFEEHNGQNAIILEDDVVISQDALQFFEMATSKYSKNPNFMGVNFGSVEPPRVNSENEYFLLRFGIHGPASGLTRRTWLRIAPYLGLLLERSKHFDLAFEFFLRKGFMVTPSRSRYLDLGAYGTHAGSGDLPYFKGLQESWLGNPTSTSTSQWYLAKPTKPFRDDCFVYRPLENPFFNALWRLNLGADGPISELFFKLVYKFVYLPKCYLNRVV